jgi:NTP pyrophosphatase (non-canonical NTP hydrolase)
VNYILVSDIQPHTLKAVRKEVHRARAKFPESKKQRRALMDALVEEVGELAKARLEHGPKSEQAHVEASHVACVAIRMMEEMGYVRRVK